MKGKLWKIVVASLVVVAAITCAVLFLPTNQDIGTKGEGSNILSLIKPPIVSAAGEGTNFLDEEAGISAYTNVGQEIDLDKASAGFRTIEKETDEYIIGSVALPGYAETEDVHCYIHKDGWVVAYYLEAEPAAKIVDWNSYEGGAITSTKLENGMAVVCDAAGVPFIEAKYYHFQYPNAVNLMIAADALFEEGTDTFKVKIPADFVVYEKSWSHYASIAVDRWDFLSKMEIDGDEISSIQGEGTNYGLLLYSQLPPDEFHTIKLTAPHWTQQAFDAIVLIYQEG